MKRITRLLLIICLLLTLVSCIYTDTPPKTSNTQEPVLSPSPTPNLSISPNPSQTPNIVDENQIARAKISSIGDIMSHYTQILDAFDANTGNYDYSNSLKYVKNYTKTSDLLVANLETVMTEGEYTGYPMFNSPFQLAQNLKDIGVDIVSMANNHSFDRGFDGLVSTIKNVEKAGLDHLGTYLDPIKKEEDRGVLYKEVNGIKLVFLNYTYGTNYIRIPEEKEFSINLLYQDYMGASSVINEEQILSDLEYAKSLEPDLIIGLIHWGVEYVTYESDLQRKTADFLFDNGIDIIFGNHSHVLQPIDFQKAENTNYDKDRFVSYSQGNFMSNITRTHYTLTSNILNLYIEKDFESNITRITHYDYVPLYMLTPEWGGSRFYVLPVHDFIKQYESGDYSLINQKIYNDLLRARDICHEILGKENDKRYALRK